MYRPKGILSSVVTPFTKDGEIDEPALRALLQHQITKVDALSVTGNTGEITDLTIDEVKRICDIAMEEASGKVKVIVGALYPSMRDNLEIAKYAKAAGADAVMVSPPYYISPPADGLYEYFETIGKVGIPMIIFNHPGRTPYNLMPDMLERLMQIETFVGIKECDTDMVRVNKKIQAIKGRVSFLMGHMTLALYTWILGGDGGFFSAGNYAADLVTDLYKACKDGNMEKALELHQKVCKLNDAMSTPNFPAGPKYACDLIGLKGGYCRSPIGGLNDKEKENIKRVLVEIGVL